MHLCDPKGEHGRVLGPRPNGDLTANATAPQAPRFFPSSHRLAYCSALKHADADGVCAAPRLSKRAKVAIVDPASRDTSEQP